MSLDEQYHGHGLAHDLEVMSHSFLGRRQTLRWLGFGVIAPASLSLIGCSGGGDATTTTSTSSGTSGTSSSSSSGSSSSSSCSVVPSETAGPYPGDGSNSNSSGVVNALQLTGIVRSDIRSSIGNASGVAAGIPLTITLKLVNTNANCASLAGYAIYLWHCDSVGRYSLYSTGVTSENYLRGVQVTGSDGSVTFTTIFPGCYSGRMPHMHFEVYASQNSAITTPVSDQVKTSQIAFPIDVCNDVYATAGYSASVSNFAAISFASDNIFSDGYSSQLATVTGNTTLAFAASVEVGISA